MATLLTSPGLDRKKKTTDILNGGGTVDSLRSSAAQMVQNSAINQATIQKTGQPAVKTVNNNPNTVSSSGPVSLNTVSSSGPVSLNTVTRRGLSGAPIQSQQYRAPLSTLKTSSLSTNSSTPNFKTFSPSTIPSVTDNAEKFKAQSIERQRQQGLSGDKLFSEVDTAVKNRDLQKLNQLADNNETIRNNQSINQIRDRLIQQNERQKQRNRENTLMKDFGGNAFTNVATGAVNVLNAVGEAAGNTGRKIGETIFGKDKEEGFQWNDPADYGRMLTNLPFGMVEAIGTSLKRANNAGDIMLKAQDETDYEKKKQMVRQGAGQAISAGIDWMAPFTGLGAEGAVVDAVSQVVKPTIKTGLKQLLKEVGRNATEEAVEEGVQYVADTVGETGNFNDVKPEGILQSAALGALGGGVMSGVSRGAASLINRGTSKNTNTDASANKPVSTPKVETAINALDNLTEQHKQTNSNITATVTSQTNVLTPQLSSTLTNETSNLTNTTPFGVRATKPTLNTLKSGLRATMRSLSEPLLPKPMMVTPNGHRVPAYTPELTKSARNTQRSNMTIKPKAAPDGGDVVKTDFPVSRSLPQKEASREAKGNLKNIKNKTVPMGDSDIQATFNKNNRSELTRRHGGMSGDQYRAKVDLVGNADELFSTARDVKTQPNRKPGSKSDVSHYLAGTAYGEDGTGKTYKMTVKSEVKKDGSTHPYSITTLNEVPGGVTPKSGGQTRNAQAPLPNGSIAQKAKNIKPMTDAEAKAYVKEQVAKQQKQAKGGSVREKLGDWAADLKHALVDDAVAYERYMKGKEYKGTRQELREKIDRVRSSDMIAQQFMKDNNLTELGRMSTEDLHQFQQYLAAKRAIELHDKGVQTGRKLEEDQGFVAKIGNKFAKEEKIVRDYNRSMLDYMVDHDLISADLRTKLLAENPNYVPFQRVMDDVESNTGNRKSKQLANIGKQTVVQRIKGSDKTVENPIESIMRNTIRMINEGERNNAAKSLANTDAFRERRLAEGEKPAAGFDTLSFMEEGKQVRYEVPELVAKEMKNLNSVLPDGLDKVVQVIGAPTKMLRAGATSNNPIFALSNLVRDQLQTLVTGKVTTTLSPTGNAKAIAATFLPGKKAATLRAELARNGIIGNEYRQTYGYKSGELMKELQNEHQLPKKAWERMKHPINALGDLIGRTEYYTRAQQYFGTNGTTTQKAQAARNNTLNFGRAGSVGRVLNKMIPFLNAGIQGGRITVNQFKERPVRTTVAFAAMAGVAAAAMGANRAQDQELWDRISDEEKKNNLIIFGPDAHYDGDQNRVVGITKIPLPQMLYPVTDAVNNADTTPEAALQLGGDIITAITGVEMSNPLNQLTPTAVKPFMENALNKDFYSGREVVSEYDNNKNPEDKGAKYSSGLARELAKLTGVDAPQIDNLIADYGGSLTSGLTKSLTDNPDNKSDGGGLRDYFGKNLERRFNSTSVTSQYDIAKGEAADYKQKLKATEAFKALDADAQQKVLNAIDTDTTAIAGVKAKTEQGRSGEIKKDLTKRQQGLLEGGFDAESYITKVGSSSRSIGGNSKEISDSIPRQYQETLAQYAEMEKEDWATYVKENRTAEYDLALARYENDFANDALTKAQQVTKSKELRKLRVSKDYDKEIRDAYGLAGNRSDMQDYLGKLDDEDRAKQVDQLNALNRAMLDAGVISASTFKTRNRAINNLSGSSGSGGRKGSGKTATKTAVSALAKMSARTAIDANKKVSAPNTNRKMAKTNMKRAATTKYTVKKAKVSVKKGIK